MQIGYCKDVRCPLCLEPKELKIIRILNINTKDERNTVKCLKCDCMFDVKADGLCTVYQNLEIKEIKQTSFGDGLNEMLGGKVF